MNLYQTDKMYSSLNPAKTDNHQVTWQSNQPDEIQLSSKAKKLHT